MRDELKTKQNKQSVTTFLNRISDKKRKKDAKRALNLLKEVTGEKPTMWGSSIIGFGSYTYTNSRGKSFTYLATGFSPRKQALTFYIIPRYDDFSDLLEKLGPYTHGKCCLYIRDLDAIDENVLRNIIKRGFDIVQTRYKTEA
ncbi:MAG: DUF1801 domain-containing protein [bacterium]|nr:DUF1801 domain-containing protein [bacterium]